ncbi:hypothetical protein J6590_011360 [Homalodisca vitripennis]|nr:hypothetical protein J6590_011360 [Homalodisca vitripennis]
MVFISRLDTSVTKEKIESYLKDSQIDYFLCFELETKCDTYKSFKIGVNDSVVDQIMDPEFWDEGILIIVVCIYRSPASDPAEFLRTLEALLTYLSKWRDHIILAGGDLNGDFDITTTKATVADFLNLLRQFNCYCLKSSPTRGTRLRSDISGRMPRKRGVPHGSCLGPTLYNLLTPDFPVICKVSLLIYMQMTPYADNSFQMEKAINQMNLCSDGDNEWSVNNGLTLIVGKCMVLYTQHLSRVP